MLIRATRSFLHEARHIEEGQVIELPDNVASQLMAMGKATIYATPKKEELPPAPPVEPGGNPHDGFQLPQSPDEGDGGSPDPSLL